MLFVSVASSIVLALAGTSLAQKDYTIDPQSVSSSDRATWCQNQKAQCPLICTQNGKNDLSTEANDCDSETLVYHCVCGDGSIPDLKQYSLTIPFYECQEFGNQCVENCPNDACKSKCREDNPCGAQTPQPPNSTASISPLAGPTSSNSAASAERTGDSGDNSEGTFGGPNGGTGGTGAASGFGVGHGLLVAGGLLAFSLLL